ncbi:hypothetical protein TGDOM2_233792 [Toxoplasma gondii GAB2-2007-GAL-DOM2]|uniref:Transmembrane protein n=6 Tax=Toxoplasma gondii TaxID=5811 RepID=S7WK27_TOXGG|nr:hypothetical protein TGGT1_233792 [Toxoplasma gondii GT1]KAF4641953.1 hypothetical protein TGRH88_077650 [Toxoplasma gondii]KFG48947.1 hypothetical protein TGDOM2_233792 [Toxoplasma gondii GAB2-2007-GAL-DOM2]KFG49873.1 hypothetical protein TGFOU_233792 [Toxoplasma gondii FOU]PUA92495.1 hypothetical protein TGBR9_233792 [Toxoplasma gondii TgCATBr9]RQX75646.1 hypothetical protein TGCAST_233792 [Toxoplasma gondii CAST]
MYFGAPFFVVLTLGARAVDCGEAGVIRHDNLIDKSRFMESGSFQIPGLAGTVGDVSPSTFPVINVHMDVPNTDPLEEKRLEKDRENMARELDEVARDYNRGINDFFQIAAFQRDQVKHLERLSHLSNGLIRRALRRRV